MIPLQNVYVTLGGRGILHGCSFSVAPGEFVAVCGPNGAGKTTLLRALAGLLPGGHPTPRQTSYVAQGAHGTWGLTVRETVALGRIPHRDHDADAIADAMVRAGVAQFAERRVDTLSGGQARRVMLARALATHPATLLLDEPVADLDPAAAHAIMRLLQDFTRGGGRVVAVLHALELAAAYASRLTVLQLGRIVADGPVEATLAAAAAAFGMRLQDHARPLLVPPTPEVGSDDSG